MGSDREVHHAALQDEVCRACAVFILLTFQNNKVLNEKQEWW